MTSELFKATLTYTAVVTANGLVFSKGFSQNSNSMVPIWQLHGSH